MDIQVRINGVSIPADQVAAITVSQDVFDVSTFGSSWTQAVPSGLLDITIVLQVPDIDLQPWAYEEKT